MQHAKDLALLVLLEEQLLLNGLQEMRGESIAPGTLVPQTNRTRNVQGNIGEATREVRAPIAQHAASKLRIALPKKF